MSDSIKSRLVTFLKYKGMSQRQFAASIGVSSGYINSMRQSVSKRIRDKISEVYPDLDVEWLFNGKASDLAKVMEMKKLYNTVPIVHIDSVGGPKSDNKIHTPEYITGYIPLAAAREGDVVITQSGESMMPVIPPGALLHIRKVEDWAQYATMGCVYVVVLDDFRRLTKKVVKSKERGDKYFVLESFNPDYADEVVPKKKIVSMWKVIKVLIDFGW